MTKSVRHIFHIYHPAVVFAYILVALIWTVLTFHPVYMVLSFLTGCLYAFYLNQRYQFRRLLIGALLLWLMIALINPLFNQNGATVLFYLGDRLVTREAFFYGLVSGGTLASVLIWFACYNQLMNQEKFLYLFSRFFPAVALMLSMISRLIPVSKYKAGQITLAQKGMGMQAAGLKQKLHSGIRVSSILMSWTLEDSIETADAMRARGYGRQKRSTYSVFHWSRHDSRTAFLLLLLAISGCILMLTNTFDYFPFIAGSLFQPINLAGYGIHVLFLLYPLLLEMREKFRWHY